MKKTVQTLIEAMDTLPKKKLMRTLVSAEQVSIPELARNAR